MFGVLHRPTYEARLRAHLIRQTPSGSDDPSWFALRNVVYATGLRHLLANDSGTSYIQADDQASRYFRTASSVLSEIILCHSGLTAIQALVMMVFPLVGKHGILC